MSVVAWILFGLVASFIGSRLVNSRGPSVLLDAVLGIVGAVVGGYLFTLLAADAGGGFNLWSLFVAVSGASFLLFLYHAAAGQRSL
jgi:uncharacterized membrane protein YeaQ/YmgE (transglycosylase-associated protein family)